MISFLFIFTGISFSRSVKGTYFDFLSIDGASPFKELRLTNPLKTWMMTPPPPPFLYPDSPRLVCGRVCSIACVKLGVVVGTQAYREIRKPYICLVSILIVFHHLLSHLY